MCNIFYPSFGTLFFFSLFLTSTPTFFLSFFSLFTSPHFFHVIKKKSLCSEKVYIYSILFFLSFFSFSPCNRHIVCFRKLNNHCNTFCITEKLTFKIVQNVNYPAGHLLWVYRDVRAVAKQPFAILWLIYFTMKQRIT